MMSALVGGSGDFLNMVEVGKGSKRGCFPSETFYFVY